MDIITLTLVYLITFAMIVLVIIASMCLIDWVQPMKILSPRGKFYLAAFCALLGSVLASYAIATVFGAPVAIAMVVIGHYTNEYFAREVIERTEVNTREEILVHAYNVRDVLENGHV